MPCAIFNRTAAQSLGGGGVMVKDMSFGALFRALRIKNKETLRQYCLKRNLDTGNISKLERNLISPPMTYRQLEQYLSGLEYDQLEFDFLLTAAQNFHIAKAVRRLSKLAGGEE
jgi:hypothetical protein